MEKQDSIMKILNQKDENIISWYNSEVSIGYVWHDWSIGN